MKTCSACQVEQRIENFYARGSICKVCTRARAKAWRRANIERYRSYDRQRNQLPHRVMDRQVRSMTAKGRRSMIKRRKKFEEENPVKRAAHVEVRFALKRGEMRRDVCQYVDPSTGRRCGAKNTEGHHEDYLKPLDVWWLCKAHHDLRHVILREIARTGKDIVSDR